VTTPNCDVARKMGANKLSCLHRVDALDLNDGWLLLRGSADL
jgi:hypothetical protein